MMDWSGKPYHSLDFELKQQFGRKLYRLALDGGMSCPNRDGTLGTGGCIFCSAGGSGEFAASACGDVWEQIEQAKARVSGKLPRAEAAREPLPRYIAYFQSYTNTYAPVSRLRSLFTRAVSHPDIAALSIATRPDCLPPETIALLQTLNQAKPVWVELGLQTIHPASAERIRRGYPLPVFSSAVRRLKAAGLTVIVHVILGLPGESREMMLETISWLADIGQAGPGGEPPLIDGLKLQLLHILKGTALAEQYQNHPFPVFTMDEYIDLVIDCTELLPPRLTLHRLTGDGPKRLLIAPLWSGDKKKVLNTLHRRFRERDAWQGKRFSPAYSASDTLPPSSTVTP